MSVAPDVFLAGSTAIMNFWLTITVHTEDSTKELIESFNQGHLNA